MGQTSTKFRVAAVQAAPVFLNREATVQKACRLIEEAGRNGARLVAFPEVYIPGYPYWARYMAPFRGDKYTKELILQSVRVPSDDTEALGQAARRASAYVVMGINERDRVSPATLYNTNLIFDPQGRILGRHVKLVPTYAEKLIWSVSDGLGLRVWDTGIGRLGTLICAQNTNTLARFVLIAEGEQIHVSNYLSMPAGDPGFASFAKDVEMRCAAHALEGRLFNLASCAIIDGSVIDTLGAVPELKEMLSSGNSCYTAIHGPLGLPIAGPLDMNSEGILYADIDLNDLLMPKFRYDISTNNFNRFDLMQVQLQRRSLRPLYTLDEREPEVSAPSPEPKRLVQAVRSLLEQGNLEEAKAKLEELERVVGG